MLAQPTSVARTACARLAPTGAKTPTSATAVGRSCPVQCPALRLRSSVHNGTDRRMHPCWVSRRRLKALTDLPNLGPSIARDLRCIGIRTPADLVGRFAEDLYETLNRRTGTRHDPCVLDTFMSITSFMKGAPPRAWWTFTAERKQLLAEMR